MRITHITLATRDLARTSRFFAETLGWRPLQRPSTLPYPVAWLEMAPGCEVHLIELADFEPSPFEREFGRHVAVTYPRDDFDALKERLCATESNPWPLPAGERSSAFSSAIRMAT